MAFAILSPLQNVLEEKDLGVTAMESFKSSKQRNIAAAKAKRSLGIIKKPTFFLGVVWCY